MLYNDYLKSLADKFSRRLEDIKADYNFDNGDEFEIAVCEILRDFLPSKYGIVRGHIVSSTGLKAGDDIIIYDQERFPTLRLHKKDNYSRKENIPIEAVYAYIEAKHNLTEDTLTTAFQQIVEVKRLCQTREEYALAQYDPYIPMTTIEEDYSENYPKYRNPLFTMILSRFGTGENKSRINDAVNAMLYKKINEFLVNKNEFYPEAIVVNKDISSHIGVFEDGAITPTLFLISEKNYSYFFKNNTDLSYGGALAHLFAALDWIRLGKMPWISLINEVLPDPK